MAVKLMLSANGLIIERKSYRLIYAYTLPNVWLEQYLQDSPGVNLYSFMLVN